MEELQPGILCFNGKRAAREYLGAAAVEYGLQPQKIGATRLFVAPSTSAAANGSWNPEWWRALAELVRSTASMAVGSPRAGEDPRDRTASHEAPSAGRSRGSLCTLSRSGLKSYTEMITQQVRNRPPATRQALEQAMSNLILSDYAKEIIGLVIGWDAACSSPARGNGKTATARALVDALPGEIWIPYAIEVDGQVIRVFDTHNHTPVPHANDNHDRRWVRIRPPLVVVGGELTLDSLELAFTDTQRFYEAPLHIKSNGGVLVVDDLGRQRCSATELLNRWIVPLEYRVDYLTMSTGKKIQVPFEQIVVFATNLDESDLEDEAFMRRMGYRLHAEAPSPETYTEIFLRYARSRGLFADENLVVQLLRKYQTEGRIPKACDPRDLIDRSIDLCRLKRQPVKLTEEGLDLVWKGYFGQPTTDPRRR